MTLRIVLLSLVVIGAGCLFSGACGGEGERPPASEKKGREEIDRLIRQLKSESFKEREEAMRALMERDDALPALRAAAKTDDAEIRTRAQTAMEAINKRLGKRAIARAIARLKKGQTDCFIAEIVANREYMDEECWKAALDHMEAIHKEALKLSKGKFELAKTRDRARGARFREMLPWEHTDKLRISHTGHLKLTEGRFIKRERIVAESVNVVDGFIHESFLICDGPVEARFNLACSIVFANGDLKIGRPGELAGIGGSVVFCDGNVTLTSSIRDSIVIATGEVRMEGNAENNVILSGGDVTIGTYFPGATFKDCTIQKHQRELSPLIHLFDPALAGIEVQNSPEGLCIKKIEAKKLFARAGLRPGDQIVAVDGVKPDSRIAFRRLLRQGMSNVEPVVFEIRRGGKPVRIEVPAADRAP